WRTVSFAAASVVAHASQPISTYFNPRNPGLHASPLRHMPDSVRQTHDKGLYVNVNIATPTPFTPATALKNSPANSISRTTHERGTFHVSWLNVNLSAASRFPSIPSLLDERGKGLESHGRGSFQRGGKAASSALQQIPAEDRTAESRYPHGSRA